LLLLLLQLEHLPHTPLLPLDMHNSAAAAAAAAAATNMLLLQLIYKPFRQCSNRRQHRMRRHNPLLVPLPAAAAATMQL
jgi:hypothetical protein